MTRPRQQPTVLGQILSLLHQNGPTTRAEVTSHLGIARSAMGEATSQLSRLGLVRIGAQAMSPQRASAGRGRTSPMLELSDDGPVAAAVHLHPSGADLALIGLGGASGAPERKQIAWNREDLEPSLRRLARWILKTIENQPRPCLGVGVGVAGYVSADGRRVLSGLYLGWADVPVADILESYLPQDLAVSVRNDAALTGLAEFRRGAGRGASMLLTLSCEHVGIGGAILSAAGSALYLRHALEAGHLVLDPFGPPCPCGQKGCLELYCDGRALVRAARGTAKHEDPAAAAAIVNAARSGDPQALNIVRDIANRFGTGLAGLVNVLGPDRVVLTGLLADYLILAEFDLRMHMQNSIVARLHQTTLTTAQVPHPVVAGAAEDVFGALLNDPVQTMARLPSHPSRLRVVKSRRPTSPAKDQLQEGSS